MEQRRELCPECAVHLQVDKMSEDGYRTHYDLICPKCGHVFAEDEPCDHDDRYDVPDDYDDPYYDWHEREYEMALSECGVMPDGFCSYAGSEYCDWSCPMAKPNKGDSHGD